MFMMDEVRRPHDGEGRDPRADQIEITPRRYTTQDAGGISACTSPNGDLVPDMVHAGEGYRFHVTGLTHDERGYPSMNVETQDGWCAGCRTRLDSRSRTDARCAKTEDLEDAEVVVVSYGITSRVAQRAIRWRASRAFAGGQVPPDLRLAVPGAAHPRAGRRT